MVAQAMIMPIPSSRPQMVDTLWQVTTDLLVQVYAMHGY